MILDNMKPSLSAWSVKENKFPLNGKMENKLKFLLRYAILAPSGHNSQPWKFKIEKSSIKIIPDLLKARRKVDPDDRELYISLGAAAKNIEVAAEYFGMMYEITTKDGQIEVKFKNGKVVSKGKKLFEAITRRATYRGEFYVKTIEKNKLKSIEESISGGSIIKIIEDKNAKTSLAKLVTDADLIWFKSKSLVKELEGWLRDDIETSKDGLPNSVLSLYKVAVELKYLFSGNSRFAVKRAKRDSGWVVKSPALIILATKNDEIEDWIELGRDFEKLALTLTSLKISLGYFNVVLQLKRLRKKLAETINLKAIPQMFLRIGYAKDETDRTRRIPVDEVLL